MKFRIIEKDLEGLKVIEVQNTTHGAYFNVVPNYGGALNKIVLSDGQKLHSVHKHANNLDDFKSISLPMYVGSFLAPFPNRIKDGKYNFDGKPYQVAINDKDYHCALHGFLYDIPFLLDNIDENQGSITLHKDFLGVEGYPFQISFRITYRWFNQGLYVTTKVKNLSESNIPFGMGWHPYFDMGVPVDTLELRIPGTYYFEQDEQFIPTGKLITVNPFDQSMVIGDRFMNDCYALNDSKIHLYEPHKQIELVLEQEIEGQAYPYCMFYTPPERDCLAIEPMTCAPNAFNNGYGFRRLAKGEEFNLSYGIRVSQKSN